VPHSATALGDFATPVAVAAGPPHDRLDGGEVSKRVLFIECDSFCEFSLAVNCK
jgi:hypothetical protein